jgi:hypothetical protein
VTNASPCTNPGIAQTAVPTRENPSAPAEGFVVLRLLLDSLRSVCDDHNVMVMVMMVVVSGESRHRYAKQHHTGE